MNNAESLLNEKENSLLQCQAALDQEKILHKNLANKYDELQSQYENEKENDQLQLSQLNEKVKIIVHKSLL